MGIKKLFICPLLFGLLLSSCISTGKDLTLLSSGIGVLQSINEGIGNHQTIDTVLLNANKDTIFVFFHMGSLSYNGSTGHFASKCCPSDSTGYYYPYKISFYSSDFRDFELCSFAISDENGNKVPFISYYTVPTTMNENSHIVVDTIPFTMNIGKTLGKIDSRGDTVKHLSTLLGFEICKPYRNLKYLEIHFKIRFGNIYKEYYSVYKRKRWVEFRPKIWTLW